MGSGLSVLTSLFSEDVPVTDPSICTHKFCEKWGPGHFHCADCHSTITDETLIAEEDKIIDGIVDDSVPEDAVNRGVTIQFLVDFCNSCNCWDMSTRDVRRRFVMPATRATRCRFVELPEMAGIAGRATSFVSHTWGAKFGDLVAALCDGNADRSRVVWVDIFAVRQWPSHKPDLDFSAVVRQCKSFVIVCSSFDELESSETIPSHIRLQIAFFRVWCLVEIHAAIVSGANIIMKGGKRHQDNDKVSFVSNVNMLFALFSRVDIGEAEATVPADKERILNGIKDTTEGGIEAVNRVIRGILFASSTASMFPFVQNAACGDAKAINVLLKRPNVHLLSVAECGYADVLQILLDGGADADSEHGRLGLFKAAMLGYPECCDKLICSGADINNVDQEGNTPLMIAAMNGQTSCVAFLLSKEECDVTVKDPNGKTALVIAEERQHTACVELLASRY